MEENTVIDFRLVEIEIETSTLKEHIALIEEQISQAEKAAKKKLDDGLRSLTADSDYGYESDMLSFEHDYLTESFLPRVYRSPFIVVLFAVYETAVTEIADLIQSGQGQTRDLKRGGGNVDFLTKAKAYYRDVLGMELSRNEDHWKRLEVLREVRNVIAHTNGRFEMASNKQKEVLRKEGLAHGYGWVLACKDFLAEMHTVVSEELEDLAERYKAWDSARSRNC